MIRDLFTNPDAFFEDAAEDGGLLRPAGVVLFVGVIGAIASVPGSRAVSSAMPPEAGPFASFLLVFGVVGALVGAFVGWLLYAGIFHGLSAVAFDGDGSFSETLAVTCWGFVPAVFGVLITAAASFYVFQGVTVPSDPQGMGAFVTQLTNRPEFVVASVLGVAFLLWQGFLWTFGVSHVRDLSLREAAITVAVPVVVDLAYRAWVLF